MFEQVREQDKEEFENILMECGFSSNENSEHKRLAVNLARIVWKHQQNKIDDVKYKIHAYTSSLDGLINL
jgi:hypothetical protein